VGLLFLQVLALAVQVKRNVENEPTRLIRVWSVNAVSPLEKGILGVQHGVSNLWHNYFYLRGVRQENRDLKAEIERLRIEQVRLSEDAQQARRLQALFAFKEQYIAKTVAAQVIGSSGSEQSRSITIDKGSEAGIAPGMAVITGDGIVGKILRVYDRTTSQVLLIDDQTSGVGAILESSRLQGILRGTPAGELVLEKVMADETVQTGEKVVTSGGDRIFPKGFNVGTVNKVSLPTAADPFLYIRIKPAVNLSKLEEVLVITQLQEKEPAVDQTGNMRAVDILAQRLPSVPEKPPETNATAGTKPAEQGTKPNPSPSDAQKQPATAKPNSAPADAQKQPATVKPNAVAVQSSTPSVSLVKSSDQGAKPEVKTATQGTAAPEKAPAVAKPKPASKPDAPKPEPKPAEDQPQ
jgi:rod shape-determining protein MreC